PLIGCISRRGDARQSQIDVQPEARHDHWPAVAVVARIVDVLHVESGEDALPQVEVVERLEDVLAPVVEGSVAEQEAESTVREVELVVAPDAVGDEHRSGLVEFAPPLRAVDSGADLDGLVYFGV